MGLMGHSREQQSFASIAIAWYCKKKYNHFRPKKYKQQTTNCFPFTKTEFCSLCTQQVHHREEKKRSDVSWWPAKCNRWRNPKSNTYNKSDSNRERLLFPSAKGGKKGTWKRMHIASNSCICIIIIIKHTKKVLLMCIRNCCETRRERAVMCNVDQLPYALNNWRNFAIVRNNNERD